MKKKINDPFANLILDEEEQLIEEALERAKFDESDNFKETQEMLARAAKKHLELHKSKPITIRINQLDLIKVKAKAKRQNIPYQTLLGVLINQYAQGKMGLKLE